jgi:hypothetical protein
MMDMKTMLNQRPILFGLAQVCGPIEVLPVRYPRPISWVALIA